MEIVNLVRGLSVSHKYSKHNDDLFVDRLNHKYTVTIIIIFTIVVTASQYGGNPINCWVPGHFTGNYANYAENICWVSSTYNVPLNEDLPNEENERKVKMLKYYQWTPFILLFQALLFYIPRMIWRSLNEKSGIDIQSIVDAVFSYQRDISKQQQQDREKLLDYLTNSFDHYVSSITSNEHRPLYLNTNNSVPNKSQENPTLHKRKNMYTIQEAGLNKKKLNETDSPVSDVEYEDDDFETAANFQKSKFQHSMSKLRRLSRIFCITKGKRLGNYLLALFVFVKLLYTLNSIVQLFLLNHFLGNDYLLLGVEVLGKIWSGDDWTQLKRFPRVTMCDFRIREVGIVHRYTVQCVLSINLFNEKIFIFLWFWLCIVSIFNICDLFSWTYTLILNNHERYTYVKRRLVALNPTTSNKNLYFNFSDNEEKRLFKKFVNNYLREDGVLALRLLSRNSQDLIVSEVIANLFRLYKEQNRHQKQQQTGIFNKQNTEIEMIEEDENQDVNELPVTNKIHANRELNV